MTTSHGLNVWLQRRFFHWAHQGGAREAPSNTLCAMREALDAGAHGLEFDVHRTADNAIVVMHDKTLGRTTNAEEIGLGGTTRIADCTVEELRRLDAAYWWVPDTVVDHDAPKERYELRGRAPADHDLGVPTLDEVLERFHGPFTIEIKDKRAPARVIQLLQDHRVPPEDVIVTSFRERTVWNLRWRIFRSKAKFGIAPGGLSTLLFFVRSRLGWAQKRSPYVAIQVPHRISSEDLPARYQRVARFLPRRWRSLTVVDERFLAHAKQAGVAVHVWTIDEREEMRELIDMRVDGVDGIMTDRPSVLTAVLAEP
jgi:glycerophosphoryl diester phosphodiesterase